MDLSSVIEALITGTYTVTRPAASSYTAGRLDTPSSSTFPIDACVQPAGGRDLLRLPEGQRTREAKSIWTATELRTQTPSNGPDLVQIDGDTYQVEAVERWADSGAYWKALALKTGD